MGREKTKIANGVNIVAGLWLMLSAYFMRLGFTSSEFIVGTLVLVLSLVGFYMAAAIWTGWVNAVFGLWLLVSSLMATGVAASITVNGLIFGIIILTAGVWGAMTSSSSSIGHGHPSM